VITDPTPGQLLFPQPRGRDDCGNPDLKNLPPSEVDPPLADRGLNAVCRATSRNLSTSTLA
jgi:hypothetical protein